MSWKNIELAKVCEVFADGDWIESKDQSDIGIRLIQTGNVGFGRFKARDSKARYISEETFKRLRCTEIKEGDLLVSRLPDPVGRACIIPQLVDKSITAVDCTIIRTKQEILYSNYLNYYCQSPQYFEQVKKNITGATRQRISRSLLGKTLIPLAPIATQQKIVAKLDAIFTEIDKATAAAEANVKNAELYFAYFLDELIDSFQSKNVRKIDDVCDLYQGLAINKKTSHLLVEKSNIPLLRIKDLKNGTVEQYVVESGFPKNSLVQENEIIYTRTGSLGLVFMGRYGVLHNNSFKVIPREGVDNKFLFWWLQSSKFKTKIMSLAMKAAQPDISHKIFKEQEIVIPSLNEQKLFSTKAETALSVTDSLKTIYQNKCKELTYLKNSILKQAFAGELVKE